MSKSCAQPQPLAHARQVRVGQPAGEVRGRGDVGPAASAAPSPASRARPCRASARRSGRRPGKIGSPAASVEVQPSGRSLFALQVEDRGLGRLPAGVGLLGLVELVEHAVDRIDDDARAGRRLA